MGVSILPTLRVLKPVGMMAAVGFVGLLVGYFANAAFYPGTTPVQPIEFSHRIHAGSPEDGGYEIPCLYCHTQARRSMSAGVPSVNKCMGCHSVVATDSPLIREVTRYFENNEPIPWVKVHDLPDFVYFPHKRHVAAGLECQECHGPVETMDRVTRLAPNEMGQCLTCHKDSEVEHGIDCLTCHK